jgi:hypothetical protein
MLGAITALIALKSPATPRSGAPYRTEFYNMGAMRTLLHTEFAALLTRTGTSQARFSPGQINNGCRGRAAVPPWAAVLAAILDERAPDALEMVVEDARFSWHETLGVPPGAEADAIRLADGRLARRYASDQGGTKRQRARLKAAYAQARTTPEDPSPVEEAEDMPPPRP